MLKGKVDKKYSHGCALDKKVTAIPIAKLSCFCNFVVILNS